MGLRSSVERVPHCSYVYHRLHAHRDKTVEILPNNKIPLNSKVFSYQAENRRLLRATLTSYRKRSTKKVLLQRIRKLL